MDTKTALLQRRSELSPAKQALLEKRRRREPVGEGTRMTVTVPRGVPTIHGDAALSFAQQRFWFLQQLEPESFTIKLIDLQNVPAAEREAVLQCNMTQQAQYPFDLEREVPWRMVLLKLDEEEHVVLTVMHHIITDAWSMEVFARELATLYAAFSAKQPSPLPELPLQYTDYARWQQQRLEGGELAGELAYWKRQLGGTLPVLELPTDRPRSALLTHRGQQRALLLPDSLGRAL